MQVPFVGTVSQDALSSTLDYSSSEEESFTSTAEMEVPFGAAGALRGGPGGSQRGLADPALRPGRGQDARAAGPLHVRLAEARRCDTAGDDAQPFLQR